MTVRAVIKALRHYQKQFGDDIELLVKDSDGKYYDFFLEMPVATHSKPTVMCVSEKNAGLSTSLPLAAETVRLRREFAKKAIDYDTLLASLLQDVPRSVLGNIFSDSREFRGYMPGEIPTIQTRQLINNDRQ